MTDTPQPLCQRVIAWWRQHFGKEPSWSFTFAHIAARLNGTSYDDEFAKEQKQRADSLEAWKAGL